MPVNPSITSTLSIASGSVNITSSIISSAAFQRPNIPQKQVYPLDSVPSPTLQFPSDRPKYYMMFDVYDYSRVNLQSIGLLTKTSQTPSFILPLSNEIKDSHLVKWEDVDLGTILGYGMDKIMPMIQNNVDSMIGKGLLSVGTAAVLGAVQGATNKITDTAAFAASKAYLGFSPNQFMTVLFSGPTYKRHTFSWSLSPRNFAEADTLRKITNAVNNFQAPKKALEGFFWTFPKIFWISFMPNSKFLFKFKPAVLESFVVDYTSAGRASFHHDSNFRNPNEIGVVETASEGNNPPASITIQMKFIELEFWLNGDYNDSNNPHNVYTSVEDSAFNNSVTGAARQVTGELIRGSNDIDRGIGDGAQQIINDIFGSRNVRGTGGEAF